MNLVLFSRQEIDRPLPLQDRRARHIIDILRRKSGDSFDAGIVGEARGKATIVAIDSESLRFTFAPTHCRTQSENIVLIVGLPRPQTARDILRDATTLGVAAMHFVLTETSDINYAQSSLWRSDEWKRHLVAGAEQAFDTAIPTVTFGNPLNNALAQLEPLRDTRIALDNYEATATLTEASRCDGATAADECDGRLPESLCLAVGPERGWTERDRASLREKGFIFARLGHRVLRTETAVIAALSVLKSARGLF